MEDYRGLSDEEIARLLKLYNIPHGPVVGSTRKLYEKKIYEYESQRTKLSPVTASSPYQYAEDFEGEVYGSRQGQDEDEDMDEGDEVDYDSYYEESYTTTKTYGETDIGAIPAAKTSTSFQEPLPSTSYSSGSSKAPTFHLRQRVRENILYPVTQEENVDSAFNWDRNAYQTISHYRTDTSSSPASSSSSSLLVSSPFSSTPVSSRWRSLPPEARQAIRPDQGPGDKHGKNERMVPLWVQFLLFIGFAFFLAFLYYFIQSDDDNPFFLRN